MSATQKVMGHVYAIFTILVWGSCFVLTKVMLTAYTPTQIIPLRMGLAYLTLWALRPRTLKLPWKDELMFILIGITGGTGAGQHLLQQQGLRVGEPLPVRRHRFDSVLPVLSVLLVHVPIIPHSSWTSVRKSDKLCIMLVNIVRTGVIR